MLSRNNVENCRLTVVACFGNSHWAGDVMYWRAVARYKATNDHSVVGKVAEELRRVYPTGVWTAKGVD